MISALVFLSIFCLYVSTLFPVSPGGPAADLTTAILTLDPLYAGPKILWVLMAKCWAGIFPFGGIEYRINAFSALWGAGSALLWARLLTQLPQTTSRHLPAIVAIEQNRWRQTAIWIAVILWSTIPQVWTSSISGDGKSFELCLLILMGIISLNLKNNLRQQILLVFLSGLLVWMDAIYIIAVLIIFVHSHFLTALKYNVMARKKTMPMFLGLFCLGFLLSPAINLFLMFQQSMPLTLGKIFDIWIGHPLTTLFWANWGELPSWSVTTNIIKGWKEAWTPLGILFLIWGGIQLWKKDQKQTLKWTGSLALLGSFFLWGTNIKDDPYALLQFDALLPMCFLGGHVLLFSGLYYAGLKWVWMRYLAVALIPLSLWSHMDVSGRGDFTSHDWARQFLLSLPQDAVIWAPDPLATSVFHLQQKGFYFRSDINIKQENDLTNFYHPFVFSTHWRSFSLLRPDTSWDETTLGKNILMYGLAYRYFPQDQFRLVTPQKQLPLLNTTFDFYTHLQKGRHLTSSIRIKKHRASAALQKRMALAHYHIGLEFLNHGLREKARVSFIHALSVDSKLTEAYHALGQMAYDENEGAQAVAYWHRAVEKDENRFDLWFKLGLAYIKEGREKPAMRALRSAIKINPNNEESRFELARLLEKNGFYDDAVKEWERLRDDNPNNQTYHWRLTHTYTALQRYEHALGTVQEYLLLDLTPSQKNQADDFRFELLKKLGRAPQIPQAVVEPRDDVITSTSIANIDDTSDVPKVEKDHQKNTDDSNSMTPTP